MNPSHVREPVVAGLFFPREERVLRDEIHALIERCGQPEVPGMVMGLISPHAGYRYSGLTAAHGYSLLQGKHYESVIIVAPSHNEFFDGISVFAGDAYRTPFGVVPVHGDLKRELAASGSCVTLDFHGHGTEHAIEVQLPFLQEVLDHLTIVPIVIGNQSKEICIELGRVLAKVTEGKQVLLMASTDLSHYHARAEAERLDRVFIDDVAAFDYARLLEDLADGRTEACGGGPVASVLCALHLNGAERVEILDYRTSGDVTGDDHPVVGYLSAAVLA